MVDKLLVRAYNVEVGDCIYCRIPDARIIDGRKEAFHILIDCGTKGSERVLHPAIKNLEQILPAAAGGKKRLDLLVVTHEHEDHMKGFDPELFKNFKIENIWLSAAMDPDHPQAKKSRRIQTIATVAMRGLAERGLALSPEVEDLMNLFKVDNDVATSALRDTIPDANGIEPVYVYAGIAKSKVKLPLDNTVASITVVAPEDNIDDYYLGDEADDPIRAFNADSPPFLVKSKGLSVFPTNIGAADFRRLQSRMLSGALAFAELSSAVTNNTSVVLLIEWKGRRLLFVGDAEWHGEYKKGKKNGSWNVMWNKQKTLLGKPLDFLKIGHHGSENSTPWNDGDTRASEPAQILDAILPLPKTGEKPTAKAIVSTARKNYKTIPRGDLMVEIGRRVSNTAKYGPALKKKGALPASTPVFKTYEQPHLEEAQPLRTDFEALLSGQDYVDIEIQEK